MSEDLVKAGTLGIQVQSQANPESDLLLDVRSLVQNKPELQALFRQFRAEERTPQWLQDRVALSVAVELPDTYSFKEVSEACLYLADEYHQLGDGYFLVSTETGRVEVVLSEDDLYSPGAMARDSGKSAEGLVRIKPHLEKAIVAFHHARDHEAATQATLTVKLHQTALLKEEGDYRLRITTREGRTGIAKDLAGDDAHELLRRSGGTTGMFMRHFELAEERTMTPDQEIIQGVAVFRSTMDVKDALAANLSYNRLGTLKGAAPQGWVRGIARAFSQKVYELVNPPAFSVEDVHDGALDADLWLAEPDTVAFFRQHNKMVAPVECTAPLGLKGPVGVLVVPRSFQVETHEEFGKWEIIATLPYKLFFRLHHLKPLNLVGLSHDAVVVH